MMDFDRKDEVLKKIEENGTMYQQIQQMQQLLIQLAGMVLDLVEGRIFGSGQCHGRPGYNRHDRG